MTRMGASVRVQRYPGMPHTVNQEELEICRAMVEKIVAAPAERAR